MFRLKEKEGPLHNLNLRRLSAFERFVQHFKGFPRSHLKKPEVDGERPEVKPHDILFPSPKAYTNKLTFILSFRRLQRKQWRPKKYIRKLPFRDCKVCEPGHGKNVSYTSGTSPNKLKNSINKLLR